MSSMARFVLLYHDCPPNYMRASHWDLMLEADGVLRTWAIARLPRGWSNARERTAVIGSECPPLADQNRVAAERLSDHRIEYLQLEGPLSADRGSVRRIDEGTYEIVAACDDAWQFRLAGELICAEAMIDQGTLTLPSPGGRG
jgi:hypothetical protein